MKTIFSVIILTYLFSPTWAAIQCYKCTTTRPPLYSNETTRLCADFDYSDRFIVTCPYSTFCAKRHFSAKIPSNVNAFERDCAHQKYVTQRIKNGSWQPEIVIEEPYQVGCSIVDDKGVRTSRTIDCYCNSYLCNGTSCKLGSLTVIFLAIINWLK